jgi:hypothetical protein
MFDNYNLIGTPITGVQYTLWAKPFKEIAQYQIQVTEDVPLNQNYIKIKSLYGDFVLSKGDYLNFQGRAVITKQDVIVTTDETEIPVYNIFELYAGDTTSTFALTLIASDANSSTNIGYETASTTTKETGKWSLKAITKRDSDIEFQGAMIVSDRINQYLFKRQRYYLEFRNPIYFDNRIGTYMGVVEGVFSITDDKLITLKGQLLPNRRLREWELTGNDDNPRYCPALPQFGYSFIVAKEQDTVFYCPLDIVIFETGYTIILSEDLASYCPLDTSIFN